MVGIIFSNIDIFFSIVLICLYAINVFFTKDLFFRFLIFFCSEFIGIMSLLFTFYRQDNFLILLLLNIIFMLLLVYLLFYSKNNKEIVDIPIGHTKKSTVLASVVFFVIVFSMFVFSFIKINNKEVIHSTDSNLVVAKRSYIKNKNGVDVKNEIPNIKNRKTDYQYIKQPEVFGNAEFLQKYNFLIISYAAFVALMFFLSKSNQGINKEKENEK